jgi:hypothetical protein
MTHVLSQFAEVILDEVADDELRRRILARINELSAGLQAAVAGGEP